ncbi:Cytochrome c oxidase assembly protein CtaG [Nereida ignava]|uniref:Cytochrome c oxidase assembly protein CtaG n=2 Tax=Roseobacteraceae TaxID=2854170 RepID=A0A0U1NN99_9RHOB|nr:Cytochrome c oxidase assembly protein CtaG [Nereida ignava]SFJ58841.1 cytochrome c oxidase assembly protein subunit 11 [Nereida ignava DSM 16309]
MTEMTSKLNTAKKLVGVVVIMGALAWASVPLYDLFCRVTGYGGTTNASTGNTEGVLDQTIKVRFDASTARDMPWEFKPEQRQMELKIGQDGMAFYEAYNPTDKPIRGTASYNVAPYAAGAYFSKIHCFCFEEQILQPGERMSMPVNFYVDPDIVNDREGKYVHTITLSYTFHMMDDQTGMDADDQQAALIEPTPETPLTSQLQ